MKWGALVKREEGEIWNVSDYQLLLPSPLLKTTQLSVLCSLKSIRVLFTNPFLCSW